MSKIYLLNNMKFDGVENIEVFGITFLKPSIDFKQYDALIFTSKNAVYSIDKISSSWKNVPSYAIAPKTANEIKKLDGKLVFIGKSSHGNEFALELINELKNKKTLYLKAEKTVSNLVEILKENNIFIEDIVTYKTTLKTCHKKLENDSIIVFTSPSSVEGFFKNYEWKDSYKAVVIGKTTAKYLPTQVKYMVSSKTSVEECIKLAKELIV